MELYVSVTAYSETMTEDEWRSLLGPEFIGDDTDGWETEYGVSEAAGPGDTRWLYWTSNTNSWWHEVGEAHVVDLLELRSDITAIEIRVENHDANYDDVVAARVITRDGETSFAPVLVPDTYRAMVQAIRDQRAAGNEHGAWLTVEQLLDGIEKGASL